LPLTEEVNDLIKDGVKVHWGPCSPCGNDTGPTAAHGPVRINMCSRYHKWLGKESRKCASGCPGHLGQPGGAGTRGGSSAPLPAGARGVAVWTLLDTAADCGACSGYV